MNRTSVIGLSLAVLLIGGSAIAGLPYWSWFWVGVAVWLVIMELYAVSKTRMTISQQFWLKRKTNPTMAWIVFGIYALFFLLLLIHLLGGI